MSHAQANPRLFADTEKFRAFRDPGNPGRGRQVMQVSTVLLGALLLAYAPSKALAQSSTSGSINISVVDPGGSLIPGADLELQNRETNDVRRAATQNSGTYAFPDLQFGTYRLTISKTGFEKRIYESVVVQTGRITDIAAMLSIGSTTETVTVAGGETPLVDVSSNTISDTIDTKQVVNLPIAGRNVIGLANLIPGYNGTFDNLPGGAIVSVDFDGTPGSSNRFRGNGGFNPVVQPRIENVAEMTISTAQLDLSGSGTSAMRIAIVTRHGSNEFHGRLYEDFRNTVLNANSWFNNARGLPRNILKLNEFGGSVGGPIIKNKLFFFGTWAQSIQPGSSNVNSNVLSPGAQQGLFSYKDATGGIQTVNLPQIAGNAGYRSAVLPFVSSELQKINGVLNLGVITPSTDPNINTLSFLVTNKTTVYYPTIRVDYVATDNVRLNLSYTQNKTNAEGVSSPQFPGGIDKALNQTSNRLNNRIAGVGVDWTIRPTLINQFHGGFLYNYTINSPEALGLAGLLPNLFETQWSYGLSLYGTAYPKRPISNEYPMFSLNDSVSWQRGNHAFVFGGSWYREQDHYWNGPGGEPNYSFNGLAGQDPLGAVFQTALGSLSSANFSNAQILYAELTGRVSSVGIAVGHPLDPASKTYKQFGAYNLDEVQGAGGLWAQDRWRIRPNLTLNYGLRWDFYGDDYDVNGGYSTLPTLGDLWGPTPVGKIFQPGTLGGVQNPQFVPRFTPTSRRGRMRRRRSRWPGVRMRIQASLENSLAKTRRSYARATR